MYLLGKDVDEVVGHLDDDEEIAWLVSIDDLHWRAHSTHPPLVTTRFALWHVPSGPIEMQDDRGRVIEVRDPWDGWSALPNPHDPRIPNIGNHPGFITIDLDIFDPTVIGRSGFGWIGNYFRPIGDKAGPETVQWWKRLRRWVAKRAVRVPPTGPLDGPKPSVWAFPEALAAMRSGANRAINPTWMKRMPK